MKIAPVSDTADESIGRLVLTCWIVFMLATASQVAAAAE